MTAGFSCKMPKPAVIDRRYSSATSVRIVIDGTSHLYPTRWPSTGSRTQQRNLWNHGRSEHLQDDVGFLQGTGEVGDPAAFSIQHGRSVEKISRVLRDHFGRTATLRSNVWAAPHAGEASSL